MASCYEALIPPQCASALGSGVVGERMASHHVLQHSWKQSKDSTRPVLLDVSSPGQEVLLGKAGKRYQKPSQEAQGGIVKEEECRERFSGVAMQTGAVARARAETLCLPHGSNLHCQAGKLPPFLWSCLVRGLQKAYMKRQEAVIFFLNCSMHARNRL